MDPLVSSLDDGDLEISTMMSEVMPPSLSPSPPPSYHSSSPSSRVTDDLFPSFDLKMMDPSRTHRMMATPSPPHSSPSSSPPFSSNINPLSISIKHEKKDPQEEEEDNPFIHGMVDMGPFLSDTSSASTSNIMNLRSIKQEATITTTTINTTTNMPSSSCSLIKSQSPMLSSSLPQSPPNSPMTTTLPSSIITPSSVMAPSSLIIHHPPPPPPPPPPQQQQPQQQMSSLFPPPTSTPSFSYLTTSSSTDPININTSSVATSSMKVEPCAPMLATSLSPTYSDAPEMMGPIVGGKGKMQSGGTKGNGCGRPGQIICVICRSRKFYSHVQRRFGQFSCEPCSKFMKRFLRNPFKFTCYESGNCVIGRPSGEQEPRGVSVSRCKACWLKICLDKFVLEDNIREVILQHYQPIFLINASTTRLSSKPVQANSFQDGPESALEVSPSKRASTPKVAMVTTSLPSIQTRMLPHQTTTLEVALSGHGSMLPQPPPLPLPQRKRRIKDTDLSNGTDEAVSVMKKGRKVSRKTTSSIPMMTSYVGESPLTTNCTKQTMTKKETNTKKVSRSKGGGKKGQTCDSLEGNVFSKKGLSNPIDSMNKLEGNIKGKRRTKKNSKSSFTPQSSVSVVSNTPGSLSSSTPSTLVLPTFSMASSSLRSALLSGSVPSTNTPSITITTYSLPPSAPFSLFQPTSPSLVMSRPITRPPIQGLTHKTTNGHKKPTTSNVEMADVAPLEDHIPLQILEIEHMDGEETENEEIVMDPLNRTRPLPIIRKRGRGGKGIIRYNHDHDYSEMPSQLMEEDDQEHSDTDHEKVASLSSVVKRNESFLSGEEEEEDELKSFGDDLKDHLSLVNPFHYPVKSGIQESGITSQVLPCFPSRRGGSTFKSTHRREMDPNFFSTASDSLSDQGDPISGLMHRESLTPLFPSTLPRSRKNSNQNLNRNRSRKKSAPSVKPHTHVRPSRPSLSLPSSSPSSSHSSCSSSNSSSHLSHLNDSHHGLNLVMDPSTLEEEDEENIQDLDEGYGGYLDTSFAKDTLFFNEILHSNSPFL